MQWLNIIHGSAQPTPRASFRPGDEVRVWFKILEQGKERIGQFEGTVIRYRGSGFSKTFTVRRVTYGEGVERVFPVDAKVISRIEVLRQGSVKRSRLYFLRTVIGKARIAAADSQAGTTKATDAAAALAAKSSDAKPKTEPVEPAVAAAEKPSSAKTSS